MSLSIEDATTDAEHRVHHAVLVLVTAYALTFLAYNFKFLWAPLVDTVRLPLLGRFGQRRSWLWFVGLVVMAAVAVLGWADPATALPVVVAAAIGVGIAGATFDIVIDAYRIELLEPRQLGVRSGMSQYGWRIGAASAGAVALVLAARYGWAAAYAACGLFALPAVAVGVVMGEPERRRRTTRAGSSMPSNPDTAGTRRPHLEFDDVVVDADNYRVYKRGELRAIGPRAFDLLLYLMAHPHRVVSKDELFDRVWQGVAVTDNALTRAVKDLRRAVGDDARSPKYVETASRRGYRFVAPMREVPASTRVSLLVLPFDDLSAAPEAYLTEGLTEELIAQLGRANPDRLSVIARTSAMSAAAGGKPWADMARDLGVDHIVRGSVRRDDRRVQVTVHLARLPDDDPQWSETFEADAPGLLEVQQRLAAAIARQVQVQLVHDSGAPAPRPVDPAAHAALLEGRYFLQKRTADSVRNALAAFERAVAREPDLARAHVGLAHCHAFHRYHWSMGSPTAPARRAIAAAMRFATRSSWLKSRWRSFSWPDRACSSAACCTCARPTRASTPVACWWRRSFSTHRRTRAAPGYARTMRTSSRASAPFRASRPSAVPRPCPPVRSGPTSIGRSGRTGRPTIRPVACRPRSAW